MITNDRAKRLLYGITPGSLAFERSSAVRRNQQGTATYSIATWDEGPGCLSPGVEAKMK